MLSPLQMTVLNLSLSGHAWRPLSPIRLETDQISSLYDTTAVGSGLTNTDPRSTDSREIPFCVCRNCGLSSVHHLSRMPSPRPEPFTRVLSGMPLRCAVTFVFGLNLSDFILEVLSKSYLPHPHGANVQF
jgi:hypothetical protein